MKTTMRIITPSLVAAAVCLSGCSLFEITNPPSEPQLTGEPAPGSVVSVTALPVGMSAGELPAAYAKSFKFIDGVELGSRDYTLDSGAVWSMDESMDWLIIYVAGGNGYVRVNDYVMPLAIGNAVFVPKNQKVVVSNVSVDKLTVIISGPSGCVLPDELAASTVELSETSNYNGMTTVNANDVMDARGMDTLQLPEKINFNDAQTEAEENSEYILGSDPDSNPGPAATRTEAPVSLSQVQTLDASEAAAVKTSIQQQQ
ncbi:MAG: hypothetical protein PHI85_10120 [Victivallaceae bacterium]|nr:hypothetical protein [Victivallaceae bacterium]